MFGPVGRIDIGILYRVSGMDHLPVADIDTYMGYRRARRVGAGEKDQISRLGVFSGNRGTHVEKPLGCGASHTGNTALIEKENAALDELLAKGADGKSQIDKWLEQYSAIEPAE